MEVWVVSVYHRHGVNVYVASTEELAWDELHRYVEDNWEDELDDTPMPEGRDDASVAYFEMVEEEFFDMDKYLVREK